MIIDQIEEVLVDYLVQNNICLSNLANILPHVLCEVLKDHLKQPFEAIAAKDEVQDDMEKKCAYAQRDYHKTLMV